MLDVLSSSAERLQPHTGQHQWWALWRGWCLRADLPCWSAWRVDVLLYCCCMESQWWVVQLLLCSTGEPGPRNHTWPPVDIFNWYIDVHIVTCVNPGGLPIQLYSAMDNLHIIHSERICLSHRPNYQRSWAMHFSSWDSDIHIQNPISQGPP